MKTCRDCHVEKSLGDFRKGQGRCKPCQVAYVAAWRAANPDRHRANQARHRANRRDHRKAVDLARYRRRMAEDPESVRKYRREWAKTPKGAIANRLARHVRRGVELADPETRAYVEILLQDPCSYCGGPGGELDHISPISKGGGGHWSNLAAACRTCNASKNDETLLAFVAKAA